MRHTDGMLYALKSPGSQPSFFDAPRDALAIAQVRGFACVPSRDGAEVTVGRTREGAVIVRLSK